MEVYGNQLVIAGAWIQTLGAGVAAIGNTIDAAHIDCTFREEIGDELYVLGNAIEATGNSIQAIGQTSLPGSEEETPGILGSWFQAAGNLANVVGGSLVLSGESSGFDIDLIGDVTQSIGAAFEAQNTRKQVSEYALLIATGQRIQSLAVAIEAIGILFIKRGKEELGKQVIALGSYGQTAGAALSAIGVTKEYEQSTQVSRWGEGYWCY